MAVWDSIWQWAIDHFIFHAIVVLYIIIVFIFPNRKSFLFKRVKKIGATGIEFIDPSIPPDAPCPYVKARDEAFAMLRDTDSTLKNHIINTNSRMDFFNNTLSEITAIIKNMSIDQQKQLFYDVDQPDAERLAAGLKYIQQGGNGSTRPDVVKFTEKRIDVYRALIMVKPELELKEVD